MADKDTSRTVAVFLAPGMEEIEALTPVDIMFRMGIPVETVSVTDSREVTSSHNVTVLADKVISEVDLSSYDMLLLPGGMPGTLNLGSSEPLLRALLEQDARGGMIAAICAAPSVLAKCGLLKGRHATSNPNFQDVLAENGAIVSQDGVVRDGNVITSQGMGTAIDFALAIVRHYKGDAAVEAAKAAIVYKD